MNTAKLPSQKLEIQSPNRATGTRATITPDLTGLLKVQHVIAMLLKEKILAEALKQKRKAGKAKANIIERYAYSLYTRTQNGDIKAASELLECANLLVSVLGYVCENSPEPVKEALRQLARDRRFWPGKYSAHREDVDNELQMIENLGLGKNCPIDLRNKWRNKTTETTIANCLVYLLNEEKEFIRDVTIPSGNTLSEVVEKLPPLTKDNFKTWWKVAEPLFLHIYGKDFEKHKDFEEYGTHSIYKDKSNDRALIRRDIKRNLKQAFWSIAPPFIPM